MRNECNAQITLAFTEKPDGTASWVISAPDPAAEGHLWSVKPTAVPARVALAVARTLDIELGTGGVEGTPGRMERMVLDQHSRVAKELRDTIAQKKGLIASVERHEATLQALVVELDTDASGATS